MDLALQLHVDPGWCRGWHMLAEPVPWPDLPANLAVSCRGASRAEGRNAAVRYRRASRSSGTGHAVPERHRSEQARGGHRSMSAVPLGLVDMRWTDPMAAGQRRTGPTVTPDHEGASLAGNDCSDCSPIGSHSCPVAAPGGKPSPWSSRCGPRRAASVSERCCCRRRRDRATSNAAPPTQTTIARTQRAAVMTRALGQRDEGCRAGPELAPGRRSCLQHVLSTASVPSISCARAEAGSNSSDRGTQA